uniref:Uncharacterized protein n=1 Tax=Rhizophora mucronata TaxID=61149 RepID=A0A2P2NAB5_RHIMU
MPLTFVVHCFFQCLCLFSFLTFQPSSSLVLIVVIHLVSTVGFRC